MSVALKMVHEKDPKQEILDELREHLHSIRVFGAGVLVAAYQRPKMTAGGIQLPDKVRDEDKFQGKVGLVLKLGPLAFVDDANHRFGAMAPKVGDWIVYAVGDTFGMELGTRRCRVVEDVHVRLTIDKPDIVW